MSQSVVSETCPGRSQEDSEDKLRVHVLPPVSSTERLLADLTLGPPRISISPQASILWSQRLRTVEVSG